MEATQTIQDIIQALKAGKSWKMRTQDLGMLVDIINEFEPELKLDAQINYEQGKTKLVKR